MKRSIFIPKTCKVGFNEREDTYSGRLGYVIYHDGKKWRKEDSWNGWIENYTSEEEFEAKKLESYNTLAKQLLEKANRNGGKVDQWNYQLGKFIKGSITTIEEAFALIGPYEKYEFYLRKSSTDEKIKPFEFPNEAREGFVLNKKAGGEKYSWNTRQTYCRVWDPQGFEIELTIQNLLYILENTNSIKGKGLEGKFVYGWDGKELVLVPEGAPEYIEMLEYSVMQSKNIKKSELKVGGIYVDGRGNDYTYLGEGFKKSYDGFSEKKALWFGRNHYSNFGSIFETKDIKGIKKYKGDNITDYASMLEALEKSGIYSKEKPEFELVLNQTDVLLEKFKTKSHIEGFWVKDSKGKMSEIHIQENTDYNRNKYYQVYETNPHSKSKYYGYNDNKFSSLQQLTNKIELWQLKMTK